MASDAPAPNEALRALLAAIADEESNRDGEFILPPDSGCIVCTVGTADSGKLCVRHEAERSLRVHAHAQPAAPDAGLRSETEAWLRDFDHDYPGEDFYHVKLLRRWLASPQPRGGARYAARLRPRTAPPTSALTRAFAPRRPPSAQWNGP